MSSVLACSVAGLLLAASSTAQTVVLQEDFRSCVVPPVGWSEANIGIGAGWVDDTCEFAFHDDFQIASESQLISPSLDFSGLSEVWLHAVEVQTFAFATVRNAIQVSVDGGVTWADVWLSSSIDDGTYAIEVDLSAYAGLSGVKIAFDYVGFFANEWRIDQVVVDDQAFVPPLRWPNLPTNFVSADGFLETFDTLTGVVPDYLAVNSVDAAVRSFDPLGWCNMGQLANCISPRTGQYCLELGLQPGTTLFHEVSNALVIGMNGSGVSNFTMEFFAMHYGEELQVDDGVFISDDGENWTPLLTDWATLIGAGNLDTWVQLSCDLSSTSVDVSGDFFVAFAQSDDYPFAFLDGVGIDDINVGGAPPLLFNVQNLVAGQQVTLTVTGADPSSFVFMGYSLSGPGPTTTSFGVAYLSHPIEQLGRFTPNAQGEVQTSVPVPPTAIGVPVWMHALELTSIGSGIWSNPLALVVQ
jgi:hypothetical protein